MPKKELNHQLIKGLEPPAKPVEYYDTYKRGLILRLSKAGTKTFAYRYRFAGKNVRYTIGRFGDVSLAQARKKVGELRVQVNNGINPQAEKRKKRYKPKEMTFEQLCNVYSKRYLPTLKKRTQDEYQRIIDKELSQWNKLNASEITSNHVRDVLNAKAYEDDAFTMANRIRATISSIFDYGIKHVGLDMNKNPAANTPKFKKGENAKSRTYTETEIKELWDYWDSMPTLFGNYFKLLLLTGQRKTETLIMRWDDITRDKPCKSIKIDANGKARPEVFSADMWHIPDNKSDREHWVPLSDLAKQVLDELETVSGGSEFVFQSTRLENKPLTDMKNRKDEIRENTSVSDFTFHDVRRTVDTKIAEMGIDTIVCDKILNHAAKGVNEKHYNWYSYDDKKLEALQKWAWRIETIVSDEQRNAKIHKIG